MALCPACGSSHVRNDYKPAPLALRIFFVRALLCDHCNYQFKVISFAGVPTRPQQRPAGKPAVFNPPTARRVDLTRLKEGATRLESQDRQDQPRSPVQHDLRTEIKRLQAQEENDQAHQDSLPTPAAAPACTHCASTNVKRRRRT